MDQLPTPKQLIALAKACRKAGIAAFKGAGLEFTLADLPLPAGSRKKLSKDPQIDPSAISSEDTIETSEPTADELLYWSVGPEQDSSQ